MATTIETNVNHLSCTYLGVMGKTLAITTYLSFFAAFTVAARHGSETNYNQRADL